MSPVPLVIDTDPGIDDALALLLAARWSICELRAVTVVYGNTTIDRATRNARIVLARAPATAPVFVGSDRPLRRALVTARETHGPDGLGDHVLAPADAVEPSASALRDALRAQSGPVTLVTLGPLTNLATALRLDPDLVRSRVGRHVAMAGSLEAKGTASATAEFNVWCDPEACHEVIHSGLNSEFVGLDVTRQLIITAAAVHKLATHQDPEAQWLGRLLGFYVRFHEEHEGLQGAVINDPLAVALAVVPGWGRAEPGVVRVDLSDGDTRGRTGPGRLDRGDREVRFYWNFQHEPVQDLLLEQLFGRWLTRADFVP